MFKLASPSLLGKRCAPPAPQRCCHRAWRWRLQRCTAAQPDGQGHTNTGPDPAGVHTPPPWAAAQQRRWQDVSWGRNLPAHLARSLVAEELRISEEEAGARLQRLVQLLPQLQGRDGVSLQQVARLARNVGALAAGLLRLRQAFPRADVEAIVLSDPGLVLDVLASEGALERLQGQAEELRALLPGVDVDRELTAQPHLYLLRNLDSLTLAVKHIQRNMPHIAGQQILDMVTNPHVLAAVGSRSGPAPPAVARPPPVAAAAASRAAGPAGEAGQVAGDVQ